mmetsp:Transcript_17493/g.48803  ORF Transcript_17493/g.48803 Transcript_17493/m.48803 type:complete len:437 (+) Transcript_17493:3006-4316(+)
MVLGHKKPRGHLGGQDAGVDVLQAAADAHLEGLQQKPDFRVRLVHEEPSEVDHCGGNAVGVQLLLKPEGVAQQLLELRHLAGLREVVRDVVHEVAIIRDVCGVHAGGDVALEQEGVELRQEVPHSQLQAILDAAVKQQPQAVLRGPSRDNVALNLQLLHHPRDVLHADVVCPQTLQHGSRGGRVHREHRQQQQRLAELRWHCVQLESLLRQGHVHFLPGFLDGLVDGVWHRLCRRLLLLLSGGGARPLLPRSLCKPEDWNGGAGRPLRKFQGAPCFVELARGLGLTLRQHLISASSLHRVASLLQVLQRLRGSALLRSARRLRRKCLLRGGRAAWAAGGHGLCQVRLHEAAAAPPSTARSNTLGRLWRLFRGGRGDGAGACPPLFFLGSGIGGSGRHAVTRVRGGGLRLGAVGQRAPPSAGEGSHGPRAACHFQSL